MLKTKRIGNLLAALPIKERIKTDPVLHQLTQKIKKSKKKKRKLMTQMIKLMIL